MLEGLIVMNSPKSIEKNPCTNSEQFGGVTAGCFVHKYKVGRGLKPSCRGPGFMNNVWRALDSGSGELVGVMPV